MPVENAEQAETSAVVSDAPATPAVETEVETAAPVETKAETPAVYDPKPLEAKLKGKLAQAFGESSDDAEPASDTPKSEAKDVTDETSKPEEPSEEQEAAASESVAPTLPAAYVRSLKSDGWSEAEIAEHAKLPNFVAVAGKIHDRRNAETAKWAEAGRAIRQQTVQQQKPAQQQPQGFQPLKPVDTAALKEQFGDDALVDNLVKPINAAVAQINAILPVVQESQGRMQQAETAATIRQIEGFFSGKELAPFKEIYGDEASIDTDLKAQTARNKVLEMADALVVGMRAQGRTLPVTDALQMAHDSLSSEYKIQATRSTIKKELKQRSAGVTQRPTSRTSGSGGNVTVKLEKKIGGLLANAFS